MAKRINEIQISNFKFFPEISEKNKPISIKGKHFLLYGENGSGKSSIFWALYTLLECSNKENLNDLLKYFDLSNKQNLVNIHAKPLPAPNANFAENSFIKISFLDDLDDSYQLSYDNLSINGNVGAKQSNFTSDFLNYKFLYSTFNFSHSTSVDLYDHFRYLVFPYVKVGTCSVWKEDEDWSVIETDNASEIINFLDKGPNYFLTLSRKREYNCRKKNIRDLEKKINSSIVNLGNFIGQINIRGNDILKNDLKYNDITFNLKLEEVKSFHLTERTYTPPKIKLELSIIEYEGLTNKVHKIQSFLNEAKLTVISLAIRLAVLEKRPIDADMKILVLDDLMISLDMNNRDKILNVIFDKYLSNYQLFILTHDKVFFEYVKMFIKQKSNKNEWQISELYSSKDDNTNQNYPVLIESEFGYYEKAIKYFSAKDYTTSALYIRKEIEKLIYEKLPEEFTKEIDGQFHNLAHLWKIFIEKYNQLGYVFDSEFDNFFQQTKLVLLNPQAHHSLNSPVYKVELENAVSFIDILSAIPSIESKILYTKGMKFRFTHPTINYTFDFELTSEFRVDGLAGTSTTVLPKCKVLTFQFNNQEFWDVDKNQKYTPETITSILSNGGTKLDTIKRRLTSIRALQISEEIFLNKTIAVNGLWSLKEIIVKADVVI